MAREYPDHPLVGVGMVVREGDKILLGKKLTDSGRGRWSFPGGPLELEENTREGAKRN